MQISENMRKNSWNTGEINKNDVSYQNFILNYLPGDIESGFKTDLDSFKNDFTKLKRIIQGTNYDILNEIDSVSEDLNLIMDVIVVNDALTDILHQVHAEPSVRTTLRKLSTKVYF